MNENDKTIYKDREDKIMQYIIINNINFEYWV